MGCVPILPERLVYPEIFDCDYLYKSNTHVDVEASTLAECIGKRLSDPLPKSPTVKSFSLDALAKDYLRLVDDLRAIDHR